MTTSKGSKRAPRWPPKPGEQHTARVQASQGGPTCPHTRPRCPNGPKMTELDLTAFRERHFRAFESPRNPKSQPSPKTAP
eukprot:1373763-Pyramimonas_sp.AAC.1